MVLGVISFCKYVEVVTLYFDPHKSALFNLSVPVFVLNHFKPSDAKWLHFKNVQGNTGLTLYVF